MLLMSRLTSVVRHGERGVEAVRENSSEMTVMERMALALDGLLHLLRQVSFKGFVVTGMLLLIIVLSAIGVVYSSHLSRQLFAEQAILLEKNDQLQLEWAQLLLEQSAWSSPNRIESVARESLGMEVPETEKIQLIY
jgi:cell division protein FtsL